MGVTIQPAEYASWQEARTELIIDAKKPLKAQMQAELSAAANDADADAIREAFAARERQIEHEVDFKPLELHMQLGVDYNVRCSRPDASAHARSHTHPSVRGSSSRSRLCASTPRRVRKRGLSLCRSIHVLLQTTP